VEPIDVVSREIKVIHMDGFLEISATVGQVATNTLSHRIILDTRLLKHPKFYDFVLLHEYCHFLSIRNAGNQDKLLIDEDPDSIESYLQTNKFIDNYNSAELELIGSVLSSKQFPIFKYVPSKFPMMIPIKWDIRSGSPYLYERIANFFGLLLTKEVDRLQFPTLSEQLLKNIDSGKYGNNVKLLIP
jgi:hypothetical protein